MKKNIYITLASLLISTMALAQDLSLDYYSYLYNWYNVNPAYCAKGDRLSAILNVRQRSGLKSTNSMAGIKASIGGNQGMGSRLISDNRGAFQVLIADVTYGYKLSLNDKHMVYFGLSAGLNNKTFNASRIRNYDQLDATDPVLQSSNLKSNTFTSGAGFIYDFKNFEFAISAPHLIDNGQKLINKVNIMASNRFAVGEKLALTPILFYFNNPVVKNFGGAQLKTEYNNAIWLQGGYQTNSIYNLGLGVNVGVLGVGYNYMSANNLMKSQTTGTHEVILKINISNKQNNKSFDLGTGNRPEYLNKLSSIVERLNVLTANTTTDKISIKQELEKIKIELKGLSISNINPENAAEIESNLLKVDEKIKEIELRLGK